MRGRERRKERGGGRKREERGEGGVAAGVGLRRRGRARPGGWRQLDPFLDRELRGGWGSGAMHGRLHPASISTCAAATPGGARAAGICSILFFSSRTWDESAGRRQMGKEMEPGERGGSGSRTSSPSDGPADGPRHAAPRRCPRLSQDEQSVGPSALSSRAKPPVTGQQVAHGAPADSHLPQLAMEHDEQQWYKPHICSSVKFSSDEEPSCSPDPSPPPSMAASAVKRSTRKAKGERE